MRAFNRWKNRGFTLIELMIVVAIIGVLAALAIYGVRRYLLNSKTAEARGAIGRIAKDAVSAFERERSDSNVIALGQQSSASSHRLCAAASAVPGTPPAAKKYQSQPSDWGGDQDKGWKCLKFSMNEPQYFSYNYSSDGTSTTEGTTFTAVANGDLDGNTVTSSFELAGAVTSGMVRVAPNIKETNPEE